jgi:hypothetical protein
MRPISELLKIPEDEWTKEELEYVDGLLKEGYDLINTAKELFERNKK